MTYSFPNEKMTLQNDIFDLWSAYEAPSFPGGSESKESAGNTGDAGTIPGSRRSPVEGNDNPLQFSCLGNSMDIGAWWPRVHGVPKSRARLTSTQPCLLSNSSLNFVWNSPIGSVCRKRALCFCSGPYWCSSAEWLRLLFLALGKKGCSVV